ncbi:MAG TPA: hypothetical protein VHZ33_18810 [Trebonia sp.]|jgi:hypothetical protein|nr:hypothetical protein [Trebonia sp.]
MNPNLANDLATCHLRDLRHLSEQHRRHSLTTANRRHRQSPLRRQIGFRLVEAGLHLMANTSD